MRSLERTLASSDYDKVEHLTSRAFTPHRTYILYRRLFPLNVYFKHSLIDLRTFLDIFCYNLPVCTGCWGFVQFSCRQRLMTENAS